MKTFFWRTCVLRTLVLLLGISFLFCAAACDNLQKGSQPETGINLPSDEEIAAFTFEEVKFPNGINWAGLRSSPYGFLQDTTGKSFPTTADFDNYAARMAGNYEGSNGAFVWIVGVVEEETWSCYLNFPVPEGLDKIYGSETDENEAFLTMADEKGYDVWLQVESGNADILELEWLVLNRYKNHKCVKGFGVDVEWYKPAGTRGYGSKITDELAKKINTIAKMVDSGYTVFLKHWETDWMPPSYHSDFIFVTDSQGFSDADDYKRHAERWASSFSPNPVFLQIGYDRDEEVWGEFESPTKDLGEYITSDIKDSSAIGIIWVDFTLRRALDYVPIEKGAKVNYAGLRVSPYGFGRKSFPTVEDFDGYASKISSYYEGSTGAFIWLVGTVADKAEYSCSLNFPAPEGVSIPSGVHFSDEDRNEEFLSMADEKGYAVWLQVESGFADIEKLATLVMTKYKDHKCVKGFGIDAEWYQNVTDGEDGTPVDDITAEKVDKAVKKINPEYTIFIKHWDPLWMPPTYRSDIIFVNDSQGFGSLSEMKTEFAGWARTFGTNPVFFQIGYEADKAIWSRFENPIAGVGAALAAASPASSNVGIIWVDFTLKQVIK